MFGCHVIGKDRSELTIDLLDPDRYDKKIRPSLLYNDSVNVTFKLHLNKILDVVRREF